jgi:hypothetical protein
MAKAAQPIDQAKLEQALAKAEADKARLIAAKLAAGEAVSLDTVVVVGTPEAADAAVDRKLAELQARETREIFFVQPWNDKDRAKLRAGEKLDPVYDVRPPVIITGVPRAGRD